MIQRRVARGPARRSAASPSVPPTPRSAVVSHQPNKARRLCKRCSASNPSGASACATCGSTRLAPSWVLASRAVTRNFEVQTTRSSERFGPPVERITLSKWWPGSAGRSPSLHITTPEQWARVRDIVERDFAPRLGWKLLAIESGLPVATVTPDDLRELVRQYPGVAREALATKYDRVRDGPSDDAVALTDRNSAGEATSGRSFAASYRALLERLPTESGAAHAALGKLLESWSLHQVTQAAAELRGRLETIALFERLILDPKTYELRGDRSIHRVLEGALWIIDERYWLMTSNRSLRTLVGRRIGAERRRESRLRPDFACAELGAQGVIVELKRPAHRLGLADLNQAERYLVLAEQYAPQTTWSALLVGRTVSEDARRTARYRTAVTIRTFAEVLADARHRYQEYLALAGADTREARVARGRRRSGSVAVSSR